jgi:phosphoribosylglycinamide formyltransferase-1
VIQAALDVLPADTPDTLAARLLECEHVIYPRAVQWFVEDRLRLQDGVVQVINPAEPQLLMAISAGTPAAGV